MQRRLNSGRKTILALAALLAGAGCTDDLPTVGGEELFPSGTRPSTFEVTVPAERFLTTLGDFSGYTDARDAGFLLVANRFDGALEAHTLARLAPVPQTVTYTRGGQQRTDTIAALVGGALVAPLDTAASMADGVVRVRVWEVGEAWDPGSVSWELAVDTAGERVPWTTPGGTRGALLGEVELAAAAFRRDSTLRVPVDSTALKRIATEDFRGLLITAEGAGARLQLRNVRLDAEVRPRGATDTLVALSVGAGAQTFVYTPDQPSSPTAWEAGGVRSARTLFRVDLGLRVPVCPQADCPQVPLRDVTLNEVALLLDPVPVPAGFRPLGPVPILLRRVVEPELGRQAPLGEVANDVLALNPALGRAIFAGGVFDPAEPLYVVPITEFARRLAASDTTTANLALLGEGGGAAVATFGTAWFAPAPRLRIVYTVPVRPTLP